MKRAVMAQATQVHSLQEITQGLCVMTHRDDYFPAVTMRAVGPRKRGIYVRQRTGPVEDTACNLGCGGIPLFNQQLTGEK